MLRHGVLRDFVSFCMSVFVQAILSWCPNLTYLHCLQNSFCEHLFNFYCCSTYAATVLKHIFLCFFLDLFAISFRFKDTSLHMHVAEKIALSVYYTFSKGTEYTQFEMQELAFFWPTFLFQL